MIYVYRCRKCKGKEIEVEHGMSYIGNESNLPKSILDLITCKKHGLMNRVIQEPQLMGMMNGSSCSEETLRADKVKKRKIRNALHTKNEGWKQAPESERAEYRKHVEKKYAHLSGDHEKIK